jgi:transcriptional regulator with XRE-family HTH domain
MSATKATNAAPKSTLSPEFGTWLRRARMGLPQNLLEFASAAELSPGTVRDLELGHRLTGVFSIEVFVRIANTLGMELGYVLHKAGFDIGRDGIDLGRLNRIEQAVEALIRNEGDLRLALSEALAEVDVPGPTNPRREELIGELGRGLAALDRTVERLRHGGFAPVAQEPKEAEIAPRAWTEQEKAWLREHPEATNSHAAEVLGRSKEAVRIWRSRDKNGGE